MSSEYRVSPSVTALLMGVLLIVISVLVFGTTIVVAVFDLPTALLLIPAVAAIAALAASAFMLSSRGWVVRFTDDGYRVQWVRGVGVATARWKDVEDAVTTTAAGSPVVVLRLHSGLTTTIPVVVLAGDREAFVRDVQRHLQQGHGLRAL